MLPWHTTSIYDHPEDFGLKKKIAEAGVKTMGNAGICSGEFDIVAVWETEDQRLLIGHDASCACVIPFENTRVDQLTEFETVGDLVAFVEDVWRSVPPRIVQEQISILMTGIVFAPR